MTRERVEQAVEDAVLAVKVGIDCVVTEGVHAPGHEAHRTLALEALTTLSNALAESEKERERLQEALRVIAGTSVVYGGVDMKRIARQALSPDSQEKRAGHVHCYYRKNAGGQYTHSHTGGGEKHAHQGDESWYPIQNYVGGAPPDSQEKRSE